MSCSHCADGLDPSLAQRKRVLQLLALIEHPDALPAEAKIRIAQEILRWVAQNKSGFECRRSNTVESRRVATAA